METIGAIPEQISQYMQNQSNLPMGQMNPNVPNPMGGMLPGSNPMDLLQLQQFMQMQQMQQQQPRGWSLYIDGLLTQKNKVLFIVIIMSWGSERWEKKNPGGKRYI